MFSMMPNTGTSTLRNMFRPLRASSRAMSWGVDTMTAPVTGTSCARLSWMSPVPGGMSTTRMSSSPHSVCCSICLRAPVAIGPRQIMGVSSATRNPADMHFTPKFCSGMMMRLSGLCGPAFQPHHARLRRAVDIGVEHADLQAPGRPAPAPGSTATVDLPTPPLPLATATMLRTPGTTSLAGRCRCAAVGMGLRRRRRGRLRPVGGQDRADAQNARNCVHRLLRRLPQRLQLGPPLRVHLDGERDMAVAHSQAGNHAEADDVAAAIRVADPAQSGHHVGFRHGCGWLIGRRHA